MGDGKGGECPPLHPKVPGGYKEVMVDVDSRKLVLMKFSSRFPYLLTSLKGFLLISEDEKAPLNTNYKKKNYKHNILLQIKYICVVAMFLLLVNICKYLAKL